MSEEEPMAKESPFDLESWCGQADLSLPLSDIYNRYPLLSMNNRFEVFSLLIHHAYPLWREGAIGWISPLTDTPYLDLEQFYAALFLDSTKPFNEARARQARSFYFDLVEVLTGKPCSFLRDDPSGSCT